MADDTGPGTSSGSRRASIAERAPAPDSLLSHVFGVFFCLGFLDAAGVRDVDDEIEAALDDAPGVDATEEERAEEALDQKEEV